MDPVALSATEAARDMLGDSSTGPSEMVAEIRSAWQYTIASPGSAAQVEEMAKRVLGNACIETFFIHCHDRRDPLPQTFPVSPPLPFERRTVRLVGLADDELANLSRTAHLFLSVREMKAIAEHFAALGRDPTDLELETLAQTWSEHCVHKTLKSSVHYRGKGFGANSDADVEVTYDNLIKQTIFRATEELNKPWCLSVFEDNAGVVEFDETHGIAFKVETHNHPSAIEPYGGAATGAGGCIRDILGCGLGAKPIANTDVFCVADPKFDDDRIPQGVLRPQRVLRGIVSGVRDYGNRMGIPTVAGALCFDNRYLANPLVFCGCIGIMPKDRIRKQPQPGDRIVVAGGRTGRDGIGGATFSSAELTDTHADEFAHAVQIGNAIEEKKVLDALLRARDHRNGCLYSAVTDCGAGGLSSAVGEMAEKLGAVVDLEAVPLKYSGLRYNEIWLSEAQERMVFSVPPANLAEMQRIFAEEKVETSVIGEFSSDGVIELRYGDTQVGRLEVEFLFNGIPKRHHEAVWTGSRAGAMQLIETPSAAEDDLAIAVLNKLESLAACSREDVFRQYDQEVQGGTVIKPLVGNGEGPSDAAVIRPIPDKPIGIAIGCGICPQLSDQDPYWMAVAAVDEAVRNVVAVGADPERIAILDNFCWGGCQDEEEMGSLVRACQACHDAALVYQTPFISGKDSLNNQFSLPLDDAQKLGLPSRINIPATLLISAIGMVPDVSKCVTSDLKHAGNRLIHIDACLQNDGPVRCAAMHRKVADLISKSHVLACHDISDGGLAVCLAEMCIGGAKGAVLDWSEYDCNVGLTRHLFDESCSGYVLEVDSQVDISQFIGCCNVVELGRVDAKPRMVFRCRGEDVVCLDVARMKDAWRAPLGLS